jgi:hypothetical protein
VELANLPADYDLYLLDGDGTEVDRSVSDDLTPRIIDTDLEATGIYYVVVAVDAARDADPDNAYELHLTLTQAPLGAAAPVATAAPPPSPTQAPAAQATAVPTSVPASLQAASLVANPTTVGWIQPVTFTWTNNPSPSKSAWIGLFRVGADDNSRMDSWYVSCEAQTVAPVPSGSCTVTIDPRKYLKFEPAPISRNFEFRLFEDDYPNATRLATSNPIVLSVGVSADGFTGTTLEVTGKPMRVS